MGLSDEDFDDEEYDGEEDSDELNEDMTSVEDCEIESDDRYVRYSIESISVEDADTVSDFLYSVFVKKIVPKVIF